MTNVFYDDDRAYVSWADWTDTRREPEVLAFMLIVGCGSTNAIIRDVIESRRSVGYQAWERERLRLVGIYSRWRYFVTRFRGVQPRAHIEATARAMDIPARDVRDAIELVEAHGIVQEVA